MFKLLSLLAVPMLLWSCVTSSETTTTDTSSTGTQTEETQVETPTSDADTSEYTQYTAPDDAFSLSYPSNWALQEGYMGTIAMILSEVGVNDQFAENINFIGQEISAIGAKDFDEYMDISKEQMAQLFTDYTLVSESDVEVAGLSGNKLVSDFTQGTIKIQSTQYFLENDGSVFIITVTQAQEAPEEFEAEFDAILSSLKVN